MREHEDAYKAATDNEKRLKNLLDEEEMRLDVDV